MYIILLLSIAILTHLQWFNPTSILTFGDWYYWPTLALKDLLFSWGTWISYVGLGTSNVQLSFNLFMSIWSLFANIGMGYNISTKITLFIPIAIMGFVSPYLLSKKIFNNSLISFISAIFYGTTTIVLINQLPIQFVYVLAPIVLYLFIIALEKNKLTNWLIFLLSYFVSISYEIRITYIVTWILIFYALFSYGISIKKYFKNLVVSVILFIGLNLFWILPTIFGGITKTITSIIGRSVFGNQLFDISHAFTIFNWLWTGGKPDNSFNVQPVIWYFWIFPILSFSVFLFFNKFNKIQQKNLLFFGFISLLGIFLTKQSDYPFPYVYGWLYRHFPGFSLFRESSKLFLFTTIGYMGLLGYLLKAIKEYSHVRKYLFMSLSALVVVGSLWNSKPLITGEIGGLFIPRSIPIDYNLFEQYSVNQQGYFRTLWAPVYSRWSIFTITHPILGLDNSMNSDWDKFLIPQNNMHLLSSGERYMKSLSRKNMSELISISSIRYIAVPLEDKANDDDFFPNYGEPRQYYIDELNKISWLKRVDVGTKEIAVYENSSYRPHIYITQEKETITKEVPYQKIQYNSVNTTQYTLTLDHIKKPLYVNFSESYNPNWKMRVGDFSWLQVLTDKNYFLPVKWHFQNDATLNSFYIDPTVVCNVKSLSSYNIGGRECIKNADGTYTIHATLYFTPQSYMYLGLIISGATLAGILGYLSFVGYIFLRRKYAKHN